MAKKVGSRKGVKRLWEWMKRKANFKCSLFLSWTEVLDHKRKLSLASWSPDCPSFSSSVIKIHLFYKIFIKSYLFHEAWVCHSNSTEIFFLKFFFLCHFSYSDFNPSFEWYVSSLWMEEEEGCRRWKRSSKPYEPLIKPLGFEIFVKTRPRGSIIIYSESWWFVI